MTFGPWTESSPPGLALPELLGWLTGRDRDVRVITSHGGLLAGAPMVEIGA
jgi:hypothetical protein